MTSKTMRFPRPLLTRRNVRAAVTVACAVIGVAVAASLSACSSTSPSVPAGPKTLTIAMTSDVVSLDPQLQGDLTSMSIAANIFDTLTVRAADGSLQPGIATKWTQVDPMTWQFTIRQGVTFQNGEPLDANAVAYSINRLLDPATKSPIVELRNVGKAVAVDATTVNFQMKSPDPVIPAKVSLFGGVVVPPKYLADKGADAFAATPVGSGPYTFVSREQANQIVLKANPKYWGTKPQVENIIFKVIPNTASALAALQAGQVDIVTGLTKDAANQLGNTNGIQIVNTPGIRNYSINIDTITSGPLANVKVRQAINSALDKSTLINTILGGAAKESPTLLPDNVYGFDKSVSAYGYDVTRAKQLLTEAGYPNGFTVTLSASSVDSTLVQAVAGQLSTVGITANVNVVEAQKAKADVIALNKRLDGGMYLMANSGWTLDAVSYFQSVVKSDRRSSRWNDATADRLAVAGETETDPQKRQDAFSQLQKLLHDQAPFGYLFTINNVYAMRSNVNWTMPLAGVFAMASATVK